MFTYSGDPTSADKDAIRFEIGDTNPAAPIFQDAEVEYAINQETGCTAGTPTTLLAQDLYRSAARCFEILAGQLSAQADSTVGSLKLQYSNAAKNSMLRATQLRDRAVGMSAPYAGGQSVSEKESWRENTDLPAPLFSRKEYDNPWAGQGGRGGYDADFGPPVE